MKRKNGIKRERGGIEREREKERKKERKKEKDFHLVRAYSRKPSSRGCGLNVPIHPRSCLS